MWSNFIFFAIPSIILWNLGGVSAQFKGVKKWLPTVSIALGLMLFASYIFLLWFDLGRPPMKSMGETRLWYSLLLTTLGCVVYQRWKIRPILLLNTITASVFTIINILHPEIHDKELMPALQSVWFVPHVILYIMAYGMMSYATLIVIYLWLKPEKESNYIELIGRLLYCGIGLLMIGLLTGALWAKEAWGDYWSWDIKETWALITVMIYLFYLHNARSRKKLSISSRWSVIIGFIALQICWYGVNYLPAAASSVHTYGAP